MEGEVRSIPALLPDGIFANLQGCLRMITGRCHYSKYVASTERRASNLYNANNLKICTVE